MVTTAIEGTIALVGLALDTTKSGTTWRAMQKMADDLDIEAVETWAGLQAALIGWLERDRTEGRLTAEQLEFVTDLLLNMDRYEWEETVEHFEAWATWVRGGMTDD